MNQFDRDVLRVGVEQALENMITQCRENSGTTLNALALYIATNEDIQSGKISPPIMEKAGAGASKLLKSVKHQLKVNQDSYFRILGGQAARNHHMAETFIGNVKPSERMIELEDNYLTALQFNTDQLKHLESVLVDVGMNIMKQTIFNQVAKDE